MTVIKNTAKVHNVSKFTIHLYILELPIKAYYNAVSINDLTLSCIKCKTIKNKES